jgi:DIS3-like exonuclease 1
MLPGVLSEDLCSLREGVDRFAVSVLWEFDKDYRVLRTWYGRTVIRSCHALYYELAQRVFDGECTKEDLQVLPDYTQLRKEITTLVMLARKIRDDRLALGALELESTEIRFQLNDKRDPINIIPKRGQEINRVVAEYMILANKAVAERIYSQYPSCALLRRHAIPRGSRFDEFCKLAASKGFTIDTSSNKALAESLNNCVDPKDPTFNFLLRSLVTQLMEEAEYMSTGSFQVEEYYHYGEMLLLSIVSYSFRFGSRVLYSFYIPN